ncbi:MAG: YchJ family metal-binding protein [Aquabacterium sp.]
MSRAAVSSKAQGAACGGPACPCGRPLAYDACCGLYHAGPLALQAPDPESLMRSRYTAFVKDLRSYLLETWHPSERPGQIEPPEAGLQWLGLEVRRAEMLDATRGLVEFVARSKLGGRAHRLHEISEFVREDGRWFYLKARV